MPRKQKNIKEETVTPSVASGSEATSPASEGVSEGSWKKTLVSALVVVAIVLSLGAAAYFYNEYRQATKQMTPEGELEAVVSALSEIVELPMGETPSLATVTDKEKLTGQAFFEKAANGDKVLLYQTAERAFLYRPSTGKLINVTTLNVQNGVPATEEPVAETPTQSAIAPAVTPSATTEGEAGESQAEQVKTETSQETVESKVSSTIALYNGSAKVGVTQKLEDKIVAEFPEAQVTMKEKAAKSDYVGTQVIDLSGKQSEFAGKLATFVGGTVAAALPEGETNPGTDILVIVGNPAQ